MAQDELVVLVDADGTPTGTALKAEVHTTETPLHLAFSCYLQNETGEVLVTRRALEKKTWPGVWTNSACGHLAPGETAVQAAQRRVPEELGLPANCLQDIQVVLPDFSYRAVDSKGIVEWELCPVFTARIPNDVQLNPSREEVDQLFWVSPQKLFAAVDATPKVYSPWMVAQLKHLELREALSN